MYSIIDIESNGAGFRKESIIEVAIYKFDGHEIVDQFISIVNPEADITQFVQKLTGITPKMVKTAPKFHEIAKRVVEITEGTTLVGHNIEFDYRMLRQSFSRLGYEFKINTLDTISLAKKLIPGEPSYSLSKLVKNLGIPQTEIHRAGGDARATLDLFKLLISKDKGKEIIRAQFEESNSKSYINKIKELTQDLPSEKGIVHYQDAAGHILLTDFVDDVYKHAKKLFNSKSRRLKTIQDEIEQISFELTGTDIIARLMLRSSGIRKKFPLPYGLFFRNNKFLVEKKNTASVDKPVLRFRSFSQAQKVLQHIMSSLQISDIQYLNSILNLKDKSVLLVSKGRKLGEKSFLMIEEGKLLGFGFYEVFTQIQSLGKIRKLMVETKATPDIMNEVKIGLLRNDFEIIALPSN